MKKSAFNFSIDRSIGVAIKEFRNKSKLTMRDLAEISGLPHSYFGKIENYERRLTFGELEEVAEWVGINSSDIISRAKEIIRQENHGKDIFCNSSNIH